MYLSTGHRTSLFRFEGDDVRIVCPVAEREYHGYIDIYTPYGISGFVGTGPCKDFPHYWRNWAKDNGYISGYIVLNPMLANESHFLAVETYMQGTIYVLDLWLGSDRLFKNLHENRKRQLRTWEQRAVKFITDKQILTSYMLEHYPAFVRSVDAADAYHLSQDTIRFLCGLDSISLVGMCGPEGIEAVSMFSFTPYIGDYLFNVPLPRGRHHGVDLIWWGVQSLKGLQVPMLNLGGGARREDGIARFKQFFGARKIPFSCLKEVYQPDQYKELCRQACVNPDDKIGYFPPYLKG